MVASRPTWKYTSLESIRMVRRAERAEHTEGNHEDNRKRHGPAFIQGREAQEHYKDGQGEQSRSL